MDNTTTIEAPTKNDPRYGFAGVVQAVGELIEATHESELTKPTPCVEFSVKELLEHLILIPRRAAAVGSGEHWSTVDQEAQESGHLDSWHQAVHAAHAAWVDSAKLGTEFEINWGLRPGGEILATWTADMAVHGWDLATARGVDFSIDDELLTHARVVMSLIPAEGRDHPDMPFGPVVEVSDDAPVLHQLAGWAGRDPAFAGGE